MSLANNVESLDTVGQLGESSSVEPFPPSPSQVPLHYRPKKCFGCMELIFTGACEVILKLSCGCRDFMTTHIASPLLLENLCKSWQEVGG